MLLERVHQPMAEADLDGLIVTSYENVAYLSGAVIMTQKQIPERLAAVILSPGEEPTFLVCTIEETLARRDSPIQDIRGYVEFDTSPIDFIAGVIRERGLEKGRLGVEKRVLTAHYYQELQACLPDATFVAADDLLERLRMVKTPDEVTRLREAALITDRAIRAAYECGKVGAGDKLIADTLASGIQNGGADSIAFLVIGAGPSAALAHPMPSTRPLEPGDIIRCDVGGYFSGYLSDLARTAIAGEATPDHVETYRKLFDSHEETIAAARPGIRAQDLFQRCKEAFESRGLELKVPHIGHSLGLGLHEAPILHPFNDTVLEEGMVLAIEPVHRLADGTIFHVEDLVEITANGSRILSRAADWSDLFVIDG